MHRLTRVREGIAAAADLSLRVLVAPFRGEAWQPLVEADGFIPEVRLASIRKILIVEYWGIGDLVILTPTLAALRGRFPAARITLLARPVARELFAASGWVDDVIAAELPWTRFRGKYNPFRYDLPRLAKLLTRLRKERFDLALSTRMDIRDNFLLWVSGACYRVGYAGTGGACCLTDVVPAAGMGEHRVEMGLHLARHLGARVDGLSPEIPLTRDEVLEAQERLERQGLAGGGPLVAVHPWARTEARRWALHKFTEVCARLKADHGARVIVILGPGERSEIELPLLDLADMVVDSAPIRRVAALLSQCTLFFGNDGGLMHLAAACGLPVLAVFGPTEPRWFRPYGEAHRISMLRDVPCRPCFDYCWQPRPFCIQDVTVEQVVQDAADLLARAAPFVSPQPVTASGPNDP